MISNASATSFIVSDGELVLNLESAEEGGYIVTAPFDPELITEAESLEEAFENAHDAAEALRESRRTMLRNASAKTPHSP